MAIGMTITGLNELKAAAAKLPELLRQASRKVAAASATRIRDDARARLLAQLKTDRHALADGIVVTEDPANQRFIVESTAPRGQHPMVPVWNEHGTIDMPARPYMGPAARAASPTYANDMQAALDAVVQQTIG